MRLCCLFLLLISGVICFSTISPTWMTSSYFKSGNYRLISVYRNVTNGQWNDNYSFPFSSPFVSKPSLAYGLMAYSAGDMLQYEQCFINTITLNSTHFVVNVTLVSPLRLWYLSVIYLAVDPLFPYHFNSYDSVQITYPNIPIGDLTLLITGTKYFNNSINYTAQSAGRHFTSFNTSLTAFRIVVFLTTFAIRMNGSTNGINVGALWFDITSGIINATHYYLAMSCPGNLIWFDAAFSLVIYDYDSIVMNNQYEVFYEKVLIDSTHDNYYAFPSSLMDNFIMALTTFKSPNNLCSLNYIWQIFSNSTFYGSIIKQSVLVNASTMGGVSDGFTLSVLYIKTWNCPSTHPYYNLTTSLCQSDCSPYFYLSVSNCPPCYDACAGCNGNAANQCITCDANLGLTLQGSSCVCQPSKLFVSKAIGCQTLVCIPHCATCTTFTDCSQCNPAYYFDGTACVSCATGCMDCTSTHCNSCDNQNNYFINPNNLFYCQLCSVTCNCNFYYLPIVNGVCTVSTFCGDGILSATEGCDDGNNIDLDGCSSLCVVETYHTCSGSPSVCYLNLVLTPSITVVVDTCTTLTLELILSPQLPLMSSYSYNTLITEPQLTFISATYQLNSSILYEFSFTSLPISFSLTFDYTTLALNAHHLGTSVLNLSPTLSLPSSCTTPPPPPPPPPPPTPPTPPTPTPPTPTPVSNSVSPTTDMIKAICYTDYAFMVLSLLVCKIVGLQLMGTMQLSFLTLANLNEVNQILSPISQLGYVNGYNYPLNTTDSTVLPASITTLGYTPSIIDNCNIMIGIFAAQLLVSFILYLAGYFSAQPKLTSFSLRLLKEGFVTLAVFNAFNFSFAASLNFVYGTSSTSATVLSVLALAAVVVIMIGLEAASNQGFGQFKDKFKGDKVSRMYMVVTLLYRVALGILTATINSSATVPILMVGVCTFFLSYNLVNLPFTSAYHNYRANICHLTNFLTLLATLYYQHAINASITPAYLQLAALALSTVVSAAVLIYDIALFIKQFVKGKSQSIHTKERRHQRIVQDSRNNIESLPSINQNQVVFHLDQ